MSAAAGAARPEPDSLRRAATSAITVFEFVDARTRRAASFDALEQLFVVRRGQTLDDQLVEFIADCRHGEQAGVGDAQRMHRKFETLLLTRRLAFTAG